MNKAANQPTGSPARGLRLPTTLVIMTLSAGIAAGVVAACGSDVETGPQGGAGGQGGSGGTMSTTESVGIA